MIRMHSLTLAALAAAAVASAGMTDAQAHGGGRASGAYGGGAHGYAPGGQGRGGYGRGGYGRGPGGYGYGFRGPGFYRPGYYAPWYWGGYPFYGVPYPYGVPYYYPYDVYAPPPVYDAPPPPQPQPSAAVPVRPTPKPQHFIVYFPFDQAVLTEAARDVIRSAADYARRHPGDHVIIVGHTDTSGSEAYNEPLSERRAQAVREALGGDGMDVVNVEMDWKGKHDLAIDTGDGVREPLNRRVTILIEPSGQNEADAAQSNERGMR